MLGSAAFWMEKVAVTVSKVPGVKAGTWINALSWLTTVSPCRPMPKSAITTDTEFGPVVTENTGRLPGIISVTISDGVQIPGLGVGVGVGVGTGVDVGAGVGVNVGVGVGVDVGVAVGVGD